MNAEITKDVSENGVSYVEIRIFDDCDEFLITFRKYPRNVFVAVSDDRDNPGGVDISELWVAPSIILEKTPIKEFDPFSAYKKAMAHLGYFTDDEISADIVSNDYAQIESKIKEWQETSA